MCVNGEDVAAGAAVKLRHNDRIILGDSTFMRYSEGVGKLTPSVGVTFDWQFAYDEREAALEAMREMEGDTVRSRVVSRRVVPCRTVSCRVAVAHSVMLATIANVAIVPLRCRPGHQCAVSSR